jgi:hypothetical protein
LKYRKPASPAAFTAATYAPSLALVLASMFRPVSEIQMGRLVSPRMSATVVANVEPYVSWSLVR